MLKVEYGVKKYQYNVENWCFDTFYSLKTPLQQNQNY